MADFNLSLTLRELKILKKMIQHHNPDQEDEMLVIFLYNRITKLLEGKDE